MEDDYDFDMIVYDWQHRDLMRVPYVHCSVDAGFDTSKFGYCFSPPVIPQENRDYRLVCYMRIVPEDQESMTCQEAELERKHMEFLQPENIYQIEEIDEEN